MSCEIAAIPSIDRFLFKSKTNIDRQYNEFNLISREAPTIPLFHLYLKSWKIMSDYAEYKYSVRVENIQSVIRWHFLCQHYMVDL